MIENLPEIPKTGQKLFVTGRPRTTHFTQDANGKKGTSIKIMAKQIYLCDSNKIENGETENEFNTVQFDIKDQNKIEIFAQIPFEIVNEEKYSSFSLSLHYTAKYIFCLFEKSNNFKLSLFSLHRTSEGSDEKQTDFLTVFVYDDMLRNIVRNNFKRLDRVRVEGALKYKSCIDNRGKRQYKGYIEANKIAKLTTLHQDPKNLNSTTKSTRISEI